MTKLGGKDAEQLLLGMFDDLESDVRAMACRAVGVLEIEKALKPLMRILEEEQDEDVLVECLQALGRAGTEVEFEKFGGPEVWVEEEDFGTSGMPVEALRRIADWLA